MEAECWGEETAAQAPGDTRSPRVFKYWGETSVIEVKIKGRSRGGHGRGVESWDFGDYKML